MARLHDEMVKKREAGTFVRGDTRAIEIWKKKKELDSQITTIEKNTDDMNNKIHQINEHIDMLKSKLDERVAIKMLNLRESANNAELIDAEVDVMRKLHHENIVRIYEYLTPPEWRFIVMEYCSIGDVYNFIINTEDSMIVKHVKDFARSMLSALRYLHEQNIIHNDIKPENAIIHKTKRDQYIFKLADFGTAVKLNRPYENTYSGFHEMSGTPAFFAQERFKRKTGAQADIYALGVSIYWLLTGRDPKAIPPETQYLPNMGAVQRIVKLMRHPFMVNPDTILKFYEGDDVRCDALAKSFIWHSTTFAVSDRPTAETLEHHAWLRQTDVVDDVPEYIQHRLVKYAVLSQMQKIVRRNIKGMLPEADIAAMRTLFEQVTHQRLFILQDKINVSQMQMFMDDFGIEADISAADINSDGNIAVDEFITAVLAPWLWKTDYRADKIFANIDANSDNQIDLSEFAELTRDGESKEDETATLFKKIDTDHSGGISRSEFRTWIHQEE